MYQHSLVVDRLHAVPNRATFGCHCQSGRCAVKVLQNALWFVMAMVAMHHLGSIAQSLAVLASPVVTP